MNGSYAFSPIGFSGMTGGMGNTEDVRLDDSVKYFFKSDAFHGGVLYQFGKTDSSPGEAWQGNFGFDYAGFSVDGVYAKKKDAIAVASLSAAQLVTLPQDSLAATISDNESFMLGASYNTGAFKFSAGYEHIDFKNPSLPITAPFSGLGGYYISVVNNAGVPARRRHFDVVLARSELLDSRRMSTSDRRLVPLQPGQAFALVKCSVQPLPHSAVATRTSTRS